MASSETTKLPPFQARQAVGPSKVEVAFYIVWGIAAVVCGSNAVPDLVVLFVLALGAGALLLALFVRTMLLIALVVTRRDCRRPPDQTLAWVAFPLILAVTLLGSATGTFFRARVCLSQSALRAHAEQTPGTTQPISRSLQGRWIGLFRVDRVERFDGCTAFITCYGLTKSYGVLYRPQGSPPPGDRLPNGPLIGIQHLFGPWYRYTEALRTAD